MPTPDPTSTRPAPASAGNPLPVIDLQQFTAGTPGDRAAIARQVDAVCRRTGFLILAGHGVPEALCAELRAQSRRFFDLEAHEKQQVAPPYPGYPYGYFPPASETLARSRGEDTAPDLKESFNIGPLEKPARLGEGADIDFCYAPNLWPRQPPGLRAACTAYYRAMSALAAEVMRLFAAALDLPQAFFADKTGECISAMRLLNYPAVTAPPLPGQLRAGAHTDYGSLTILLADHDAPGLEIRAPGGDWLPVAAPPGTFVVNIGDLMARWTNDRWVSTMHRVALTPPEPRRQSIAFFQQPDWDAEIRCIPSCLEEGAAPKYEPVRSGPYLMSRFRRTVTVGDGGGQSAP